MLYHVSMTTTETTTMTTKTKSGKKVSIKTRTVGQCFGTESSIIYRGKALWTSRTYPLGMTGPAIEAAEAKLEEL